MTDYRQLYTKRLNRYGDNVQERIQGKREREFSEYLQNSLYLVEFDYDDECYLGSLERYKQDESRTLQYLLVKREVAIAPGTVLEIGTKKWLVMFMEDIQARGYNKYILLKMTHTFELEDKEYDCFFIGPMKSQNKDTIYTGQDKGIFMADETLNTVICAYNGDLKKDEYLEVCAKGLEDRQEEFTIKGSDILSTPGVQYTYLENTFTRYETIIEDDPSQEEIPETPSEDSFWTQF